MASVTGPDSVIPWGQLKKETSTVTEPSPTPEPSPTQTAEPTSPAPAPATATTATASSYTPEVQVQPMPERLRDLIVELRRAGGDETSLERVARDLALARSGMGVEVRQEEAALTAREIIASASTSLVAQANHNRDSARAILGSV